MSGASNSRTTYRWHEEELINGKYCYTAFAGEIDSIHFPGGASEPVTWQQHGWVRTDNHLFRVPRIVRDAI